MACDLNYSIQSLTGDCLNTDSGAFRIKINGDAPDYTITWVNPNQGDIVVLGAGVTEYEVTGLSGGTYSFNITDSCIDPSNQMILAQVRISTGFCTSVSSMYGTFCNKNNGSITASTQNDYGDYKWYLYNNTSYITSGLTDNDLSTPGIIFDELSPGSYYVRVIDEGGCTAMTNNVIIKSSNELSFTLHPIHNSSCSPTISSSGKVFVRDLIGIPPYTYEWKKNSEILTTETGSSLTGLTEGNYSVTITDGSGCSLGKSTIVTTVPKMGVADLTITPPGCFDSSGSACITISGGTSPFTFSGSNGDIIQTFENHYTFDDLPAGNFEFFVKDAGLCNFLGSFTLITPKSFNLISSETTPSSCGSNSGKISIKLSNGTPPYKYSLLNVSTGTITNKEGDTISTYEFQNLSSGDYVLTITDGGPCTKVMPLTINNEVEFDFTVSTVNTDCGSSNGSASITAIGGIGPFIYEITSTNYYNSESTTLLSHTFEDLESGSYTISVKDESLICTVEDTIYIGDSDGVNFNTVFTNPVVCNDGNIQIFITDGKPPYTIDWSSNVNGGSGVSVYNLTAGTYTIRVTDSLGCVKQNSVTLVGGNCPENSYEVFQLCENEFVNSGDVLKKGPALMLKEGYADLTNGDTNCILDKAVFDAVTIVSGVTASTKFYTGYTLNDFPSDELFAETVIDLLTSYDGIGTVTIDTEKNKLTVNTDCGSEISLLDAQININLVIHYSISCETCDT